MWLDGKWEMNSLGKEPRTEWVLKTQQFAVLRNMQSHFKLCKFHVKTFSAAIFIISMHTVEFILDTYFVLLHI